MDINKMLNKPMSLEEAKRVFREWETLCRHNATDSGDDIDKDSIELYRAIQAADKAFQRLSELEAKNSPIQIKEIHCDEYICPACGRENNNGREFKPQDKYCPNCGQKFKMED